MREYSRLIRDCYRLFGITRDYAGILTTDTGLFGITRDYQGLFGITKGLCRIIRDCQGLLYITGDYYGLLGSGRRSKFLDLDVRFEGFRFAFWVPWKVAF